MIRHPTAGPLLVDTGLHSSIVAKPVANLGRQLASYARPRLEPHETLPAQLRERGLDARQIRLCVLTHMHYDHVSALAEMPKATFIVTEAEWKAATTQARPLLQGYRPQTYNYAFDYRTLSYSGESVSSYSTFGRTFDLFGDGSVRTVFTPGHTLGHTSVVLRTARGEVLVAGDAIYMRRTLDDTHLPYRTEDDHVFRRSLREMQQYVKETPDAVVIPGHDWEEWERLEAAY